jgi:hypothetical protein
MLKPYKALPEKAQDYLDVVLLAIVFFSVASIYSPWVLFVALAVLSGFSKAVRETLNTRYNASIFSALPFNVRWWDPLKSYVLKNRFNTRFWKWAFRGPLAMFMDGYHLFYWLDVLPLLVATPLGIVFYIIHPIQPLGIVTILVTSYMMRWVTFSCGYDGKVFFKFYI